MRFITDKKMVMGEDWKKKREWLMPSSWSTPILLGSLNNFIFIAELKNTMNKQSLLSLPQPLLELNVISLPSPSLQPR
jgi:hypothetical protein